MWDAALGVTPDVRDPAPTVPVRRRNTRADRQDAAGSSQGVESSASHSKRRRVLTPFALTQRDGWDRAPGFHGWCCGTACGKVRAVLGLCTAVVSLRRPKAKR